MYTEGLEDDDDRNVFVEKVVPHVNFAKPHEDISFGFSLMSCAEQEVSGYW